MGNGKDMLRLELDVKLPAKFHAECPVPDGYLITSLQAMAAAERAGRRVQEEFERRYPEASFALAELASEYLRQEMIELVEDARRAKL